jgi:hypothetical protein
VSRVVVQREIALMPPVAGQATLSMIRHFSEESRMYPRSHPSSYTPPSQHQFSPPSTRLVLRVP